MKKIYLLSLMSLCIVYAFSQTPEQFVLDEYTSILQDFNTGNAGEGNWEQKGSSLIQNSNSFPYAKYTIPLVQTNNNHLFQIKAQASGSGKTGYGFHFFASDSHDSHGYGYGKSLLVWITRDEDHYQNKGTYIQLYQSLSDYSMIEAGSVLISESINEELNIEVYVNTSQETVFISINGDLKLFIPVQNFSFTGDFFALRTLGGPVTFKELTIRQKE